MLSWHVGVRMVRSTSMVLTLNAFTPIHIYPCDEHTASTRQSDLTALE